jgi:hypothetical protein
MSKSALLQLADDIAADRRLSADQALALRKEIFTDGVVTRQEADVLVSLNGQVSEADDAWTQAFAEGVVDHVLGCGKHAGHVDDAAAAWLMANLAGADRLSIETLLKVVEHAESAPDTLMEFVRAQVAAFIAGHTMGARDVEYVRRALYASGGAGGVAVEAAELDWLFALDAESDGRDHDPAWRDLFVKAGLCHLLGRRAPALLEPEAMLALREREQTRAPMTLRSLVGSIMSGGLKGYRERIRLPDEVTAMENHYAQVVADMEEDAMLTAAEAAAIIGIADRDGRRTANERALLDELEKIEAEQASR